MLVAAHVRKEAADQIPSAVHVDGTARPQLVSRETAPVFWSVIEHFRRLTGVPVVINTSFNVMGEPIINRPEEALRCFYSTGIDTLVLENLVLTKATG
jgi:carbamoyltransferase